MVGTEALPQMPNNKAEPLILGVDGGGSNTRSIVANAEGRVVAASFGGGVNPMGNANWQDALREAIAPLKPYFGSIVQVCFALPSYGEAEAISEAQESFVKTLIPHAKARIVNDVKAAHTGAFARTPAGILLLAGTGSMTWSVDERGDDVRLGGWGHMFSDEGSAYWIGHEALRLLCRIADRRIEGLAFFDAMSAGLDLGSSMNSVLRWYWGLAQPKSQVAALAKIVDALAEGHDATATGLLDRAVAELEDLVIATHRQLGTARLAWSYAGGLFRSRYIMARLAEKLGAPVDPVLPPVGGSLLLAAEAAGFSASFAFIGELGKTLPDELLYSPRTRQS